MITLIILLLCSIILSVIFVKWSEKPEVKDCINKAANEDNVEDIPLSKLRRYTAISVASSLFVTASLIIAGTILVKLVMFII